MSNKPKNILFRADSSSTIGTGHIMRDLVLAEQFKDANIIFATQDLTGNINHKIKEKDYAIEILNSNDIEEVNKLIEKYNIDMIVIDHYGINEKYEKQLKVQHPALKIMSLDDTYEKHHCDILLNHNIYADSSRYKNLVPENCELRCGANFTLLREEFKSEKTKKREFPQEIKNIFISMGGTDHLDISTQILKALDEVMELKIDVVTTTANPHLDELQKYVASKNNVTLYINTSQIAKLINKSNLAIITPSVTMNEVFYMEIPFIAVKTADNQKEMHNYLIKNNYISFDKFNEKDFMHSFYIKLKRKIDV